MQPQCPSCKTSINADWNFCPNCGKELKELPITISKQIFIYLVSFFLAPLGFYWGIKYVRSGNRSTQIVGIISIILTIVAIVLLIFLAKYFLDMYATAMKNFMPGGSNTIDPALMQQFLDLQKSQQQMLQELQ